MFLPTAFLILLFFSNSNPTYVSSQSDEELLLELRNNLTYDPSLSSKLVHWNESISFCRWAGVECNSNGRVSGLDLSQESISDGINGAHSPLFRLTALQSLSLSQNSFASIEFPSGFGQLAELRYLSLSSSGFSGQIPSDLSNLTRLVALDLSQDFTSSLNLPNLRRLIQNFTSLTQLHLDGVNISANGNAWGSGISSSLPNLEVLSLTSCSLSGVVPAELLRIKSLQRLHLGGNEALGGSFPEFPSGGSLLTELNVAGSNISGQIPSTIKNLRRLVVLNLAMNRFSGPVPSFALLKNLTRIDLKGNRLTGRIPDSLWEGLDNLNSLDLSGNLLEGEIPPSLFRLPLLEELLLFNNSFSGFIGASTNVVSPIRALDLSFNRLEGTIPSFLFELRNLSTLDLSSNKFNGSVELADFQKLTSLSGLVLSYNNVSVRVDETASFASLLPNVWTLKLASCKLRKLPNFANYTVLAMLDLSDNELEGEIPNWMWEGFLRFLNISHNRFSHFQEPYNLRKLDYLNLHANSLVGRIPSPLSSAVVLDFSGNNFSSISPDVGDSLRRAMFFSAADNQIAGEIPQSFCNATGLDVLDLSNNGFRGGIPSCLLNNTIRVLNLRRNELDGGVPDAFPVNCTLETLDLSRNVLEEKLPESLARCSELEVLDLANNAFDDSFPCWLRTFSKLRVLVLRNNMLHGNMSCLGETETYSWRNLQIIDLASNNITGVIPAKLFENLQALIDDENQPDHLHFSMETVVGLYYQDSVTVSMKGQTYELEKIQTIFTSIDFSDNNLQGAIPNSIGELKSLYLLNLSRNSFSGHIPSSAARAVKLQSLDLSFNGLDGEIPSELADLTFLAVLNLSYNDLVGRIPAGSQFQTFEESSFAGNAGLCGFPLDVACADEGAPPPPAFLQGEEGFSERELYVSLVLGFGVGLGFIVAPLLLCKRWRSYYDKHLTRIAFLVLRWPNQNTLKK